MKTIYKAWVINSQGASEDINYNGNTNKRAIINYIRNNYGGEWTLHIRDIMGGDDIVCITLRN